MRSLALLAALAGCATITEPPVPPSPGGESYRALGTEPFWGVTIADGRMTFEGPDRPTVTVPAPTARPTINGRRYETRRLTVDVTRTPCSDGMSDRRYPDTVRVRVGGEELSGCGYDPATGAMSLENTSWRVANIAGIRGAGATMAFAEGRISGRACNQYSGPYRVEGERLIPGAIISTKMACAGPRMAEETTLFRALAGPLTIRERASGRLVLVSGSGARIVLAPQ